MSTDLIKQCHTVDSDFCDTDATNASTGPSSEALRPWLDEIVAPARKQVVPKSRETDFNRLQESANSRIATIREIYGSSEAPDSAHSRKRTAQETRAASTSRRQLAILGTVSRYLSRTSYLSLAICSVNFARASFPVSDRPDLPCAAMLASCYFLGR
jgi:hypothetical protein